MLSQPLIWTFFALGVTIIIFTLYLKARKSSGEQDDIYRGFLDSEHDANFSRKKDPVPEDYLMVDPHIFPIRDYPDDPAYARVIARQNNALEISRLPMICNVRGLNNRELKLKYGTANLDTIVTYEENYNRFIHNLLEWSTALTALGNTTDAATVLKIAIKYHCDRSQAYTILADLISDPIMLLELREKAESILTGAVAERTLAHIDIRMDEIK